MVKTIVSSQIKIAAKFSSDGVLQDVLFPERVIFTVKSLLRMDQQLNFSTFSIQHNFRNLWNMDLETLFGRIFQKMFAQTCLCTILKLFMDEYLYTFWVRDTC